MPRWSGVFIATEVTDNPRRPQVPGSLHGTESRLINHIGVRRNEFSRVHVELKLIFDSLDLQIIDRKHESALEKRRGTTFAMRV